MLTKYRNIIICAGIGAIAGFAYYYFIGCSSGSCPITSNPYISVVYGFIAGAVIAMPGKNKKQKDDSNERNND